MAFAYPVIKTMPGYRLSRARSRIFEVYGALKFLEQDLSANYDPLLHQTYLDKVFEIEKNAKALRIPKVLSGDYYSLRTNIDFVRTLISRLESGRQGI